LVGADIDINIDVMATAAALHAAPTHSCDLTGTG
jgi:hypothetical protein